MKSPTTNLTSRVFLASPICTWGAIVLGSLALGHETVASPLPRNFNSLLENSPFGQDSAADTIAPSGQSLEFRGVVVDDECQLFNIFDPATQRSVWIEMHQLTQGYSIESFDSSHESITVVQAGKPLMLSLKRAVVIALDESPPIPSPNTPPVPTTEPVSSETSAIVQSIVAETQLMRRRNLTAKSKTYISESLPNSAF